MLSERNGLVISDIHLGQTAAQGARDLKTVDAHVRQHAPELMVLNGDIIEAEWAAGSKEQVLEKIDTATGQIRDLLQTAIQANPDVEMIYIFGNHDARYEVLASLWQLHEEFPDHFKLEEAMAQRGDTLFMHGDLPLGIGEKYQGSHKKRFADVFRGTFEFEPGHLDERPHGDEKESYWQHLEGRDGIFRKPWTHVLTAASGVVDRYVSQHTYPFNKVIKAIHETITRHDENQPEGEKLFDSVKRVAIGHIHPFPNTRGEYGGIEFVATGAGTPLKQNTMFQFDITDDGLENFEAVNLRQSRLRSSSPSQSASR